MPIFQSNLQTWAATIWKQKKKGFILSKGKGRALQGFKNEIYIMLQKLTVKLYSYSTMLAGSLW